MKYFCKIGGNTGAMGARNIRFSGKEEELISEIRKELQEKVTNRERYYYLLATTEDHGEGFYFTVLAILVFALFGSTMLYSVGSSNGTRIMAAFIMAALCAAACVAIDMYRKTVIRRHLIRKVLEEEFKDISARESNPILETNQE